MSKQIRNGYIISQVTVLFETGCEKKRNGILNAVGMELFQNVGSKEEISSKKSPFERIALLNDRGIFLTTIVCLTIMKN